MVFSAKGPGARARLLAVGDRRRPQVPTLTAVLGVMRRAMRGERDARFWGRTTPLDRVWMAVATLGLYLALGTVGLSTSITPTLTGLGKVIVIALMLFGRVGPLTIGTALFSRVPGRPRASDSDLAV